MQWKRVQISITLSMEKINNDIHEIYLIMLGIRILIWMVVLCYHKLTSTVVHCFHCVKHCRELLSLLMSLINMFAIYTNKSDLHKPRSTRSLKSTEDKMSNPESKLDSLSSKLYVFNRNIMLSLSATICKWLSLHNHSYEVFIHTNVIKYT